MEPVESEQVEVSANKLRTMISNNQEIKEKYLNECAQLKAQLRAKDEKLKVYADAVDKLKSMKLSKQHNDGSGTKKLLEEIAKSKQLDKWYEENKDKLIEDEYDRLYKKEVDDFKNSISKMFE